MVLASDGGFQLKMASKRFCVLALAFLLAIISFSGSITLHWLTFKPSVSNPKVLDHHPEFFISEEKSQNLAEVRGNAPDSIAASCSAASPSSLKVYMYDLPSEFHFGMLDERYQNRSSWPDLAVPPPRYLGGLHQQHSVEYWLTLDLLSSNLPDTRTSACTAVRVDDPAAADVFFVPFFSSLAYNKNRSGKDTANDRLQLRLVEFLMKQPTWKKNGGQDHVIVMHHPNSLHLVRSQLREAMFVLADFGRLQHHVANVDKDVVAPYKHVIANFKSDSSTFESRKTLLFFQGSIVRKEGGLIRQQLYEQLKNETEVVFTNGSTGRPGIRSATAGMRNSKFCLHPAGDTPSSNRLFDAVASHCVPVVVSDDLKPPFDDELDYSQFCVFVESKQAVLKGVLMGVLTDISREEWTEKWERLKQVARHFEYQYPALPDDAVHMTWKAIARKLPQRIRLDGTTSKPVKQAYEATYRLA